MDDPLDMHRLMQGDAMTMRHGDAPLDRAFPKGSVDLIVTSPPYNVGKEYRESGDALSYREYLKFTRKWMTTAYGWTRSTGRMCVNVALDTSKFGKQPLLADVTEVAMKCGWRYHTTILWLDGTYGQGCAWGSWASASAPHVVAPAEAILVLYKDRWKRDDPGENDITPDEFKSWVRGVWEFTGVGSRDHVAPFPRELPRRCIKLFSFIGDRVLDPFSGSGTTMVEAISLGRVGWGLELAEEHCLETVRRVQCQCKAVLQYGSAEVESRPKRTVPCWQGWAMTPGRRR